MDRLIYKYLSTNYYLGITSILPNDILKFPISFIDIANDLGLVFGLEFNEVERYIKNWIKQQNKEFNVTDYVLREIRAASQMVYEKDMQQLVTDEMRGRILREV